MTMLWMIAGAIAMVAVLLVLVRLIAGPTLIDRLIASDVLLTTLILVVGAEMVISGHTRTIPLMVVLAATGILASVAVARFVTRATVSPATSDAEEGNDGR
ncbi:monovalent cation/H+ antiporter complex subunit F [Microcella sp.]|uniref:monovalent cation/H+ antiporter complex subunit F n=1 Tax=Microcella sp. TaxID=1913979 RepID=UPI00299F8234|nr:monovalent cation/H+ antiporter complex subunit F [Microcella sp.]MDX2026081.1 monovalent cation/H+ antiporter complex subunit F [Microcella sp.]